ncbi:MAG: hypothetical protein ACRER2_05425, partial [Methylococcales bacterium]
SYNGTQSSSRPMTSSRFTARSWHLLPTKNRRAKVRFPLNQDRWVGAASKLSTGLPSIDGTSFHPSINRLPGARTRVRAGLEFPLQSEK